MTPSQQAKEFAAANGFTIEPAGRRYNVTHVASGVTFTRGGYEAVLNEMRAIADPDTPAGRTAAIAALPAEARVVPELPVATVPGMPSLSDAIAAQRVLDKNKWPWRVYVCGMEIGRFANRAEAVRRVRQDWNADVRAVGRPGVVMFYPKWSARIVYAGA